MPLQLDMVGTVEPSSTVAVRAQITGELTSVNFMEGDDVAQRQVLFTLDRRPLEAALKQSEANLARDDFAVDRPAIVLMVMKQPGTNVVAIVDAIKELLPDIRNHLPPAVSLYIQVDRSLPIRESVDDGKLTLVLTVALVVMVIFLFLRNRSATVIPSLALPASIIATFAVMYMLGYSLNNLSLMALTLSVGFVVDDAIAMLENIVRHMEMGPSPWQAALGVSSAGCSASSR